VKRGDLLRDWRGNAFKIRRVRNAIRAALESPKAQAGVVREAPAAYVAQPSESLEELKWGTRTVDARRIWLNLELAKKPIQCLEYLVMHELAHLLERHHGERFTALMDRHMPQWRHYRKTLNEAPLGHADWAY
jgi:Protein of unknown function DUF45